MNDPKTALEPIAGRLVDIYRLIKNQPFAPHSYTKLANLKYARKVSGAKTFVEIGTYRGLTATRAARLFENVITVEIDPTLHEISKKRCSKNSNITCLLGDGADLLPEISKTVDGALLYLDGHFSGADTSSSDVPEPVLIEIDLIRPWLDRYRAVVIDDFRLFGIDVGWPKKSELLQKIEQTFEHSEWSFGVLNDQILITRNS
ncbi:MAG: hypothetical protein ACX94B_10440 [Henriciella sp.]